MAENLRFTAVYESAEDGWVYVHVPELPEVHTQGRDLEEARAMVADDPAGGQRSARAQRADSRDRRHTLWLNPTTGARAAVPRHSDIKMPTGRAICRQLGVPRPEFR